MKRKIASVLAFILVLCTCMNAMAGSYSLKWVQSTDGNWHAYKNGVMLKNTWVLDDECDVPGGVWYLIDENGNIVVSPLVHDGEGRYYSFNDQHDGHYGAMITANGTYYGVGLTFEQNHNGGYGSITNADGIAALAAKYGVKEMPGIKNAQSVRLSGISSYVSSDSDSGSSEQVSSYKVSFDLGDVNVTTPSNYAAQTVKANGLVKEPVKPVATPSSADKLFRGWYKDAAGTDAWNFASDRVTKTMTLFAKWGGEEGYTVTYDGNGATAGEAPADSTAYESGDTVTIKDKGSLAKDGYQFKYWSLTSSGQGGGSYAPGDTYKINRDVTFYAIWEQASGSGSFLTFTAEEAGSSVIFNYDSGENVQYSTDGGENWKAYTNGDKITLAKTGDTVSFKGNNVVTSYTHHFVMEGKIAAGDDVTSLTNGEGGDVALTELCYASMFANCESLTAAPSLPSTSLAKNCYANMFLGCKSLTAAPSLPATELADKCYWNMFMGCESLTAAPELPAEEMKAGCYTGMFQSCKALTEMPVLAAATLAEGCYEFMFAGCDSLKTVYDLPAETLAGSCYCGMFTGCTGLKAAPEIKATTLAMACCCNMFSGCTALESSPDLPAATLAESCYLNMFFNCQSLKAAPAIGAENLADYCCNSMFYACTSLESAPALKAATLADGCYMKMFANCSALTSVPSLPAQELVDFCYQEMFSGCSSLGVYADSAEGHTKEWRLPEQGTGTDVSEFGEAMKGMLLRTAGMFVGDASGTPEINKVYYVENDPVK